MSFEFSTLKKIRLSDSNLIFGYCREAHQQFFPQNDPYYNIQTLIIYTCLAFYHIKHKWDTENIPNDCVVDGDFIEKTVASSDTTSLLKDEISNGIHEYQFRIISYGNNRNNSPYWDIGIGIISSEIAQREKHWLKYDYFTRAETGYAYTTSKAEIECYEYNTLYGNGLQCKINDVVTMIVDLENYQLKYKVNDTDLGIAFDELPSKPESYRVAVYLYERGSKIQIINEMTLHKTK